MGCGEARVVPAPGAGGQWDNGRWYRCPQRCKRMALGADIVRRTALLRVGRRRAWIGVQMGMEVPQRMGVSRRLPEEQGQTQQD